MVGSIVRSECVSNLEDNCDFIVKDIVLRPSVVNSTILRTTVEMTVV